MAYIKVEITVYKILGYSERKDQIIVGNHRVNTITKGQVIDLFKRMVNIFRHFNRTLKEEGANEKV